MLIPVFMYHDIRPDDYRLEDRGIEDAPYILAESVFDRHLEFIVSGGMTTRRICDLVHPSIDGGPGKDAPRPAVVLSFDDGDASNYDSAFRLLGRRGLTATFFITTDFVEKPGYVSWKQLEEMQAAGMEIGSHSVSHPVASLLNDSQLAYELSKSKEILEDKLGRPVETFSLPRGFRHPRLERLARDAGYAAVCTSRVGYVNTERLSPFDIARIAIKRSTGFADFASYARCRSSRMRRVIAKEKLLGWVKASLGVERYDRLRKSVLNKIYR